MRKGYGYTTCYNLENKTALFSMFRFNQPMLLPNSMLLLLTNSVDVTFGESMGHCGWKNFVFMHSLEYVKIKLVSEGKNELMELIKYILKIQEWKVPYA